MRVLCVLCRRSTTLLGVSSHLALQMFTLPCVSDSRQATMSTLLGVFEGQFHGLPEGRTQKSEKPKKQREWHQKSDGTLWLFLRKSIPYQAKPK